MNNRLDFISKFREGAVDHMTEMRVKFMALDEELRLLGMAGDSACQRAISIARTNIESAFHYTIKALCLRYEDKVSE